MRNRIPAVALGAAMLLAAGGATAMAQTVHVPLTLPAVTVVRPPEPATVTGSADRIRQLLAARSALRRTPGEQPMFQGDPAAVALQRAELARARAAQSAQTRALHGPGVDAMPDVPVSR
jgi:hypothetical protein